MRSNLEFFGTVAEAAAGCGVRDVRVSFAQWYKKARARAASGVSPSWIASTSSAAGDSRESAWTPRNRSTAAALVPEEVTKAQTDVQAAKQQLDAAKVELENASRAGDWEKAARMKHERGAAAEIPVRRGASFCSKTSEAVDGAAEQTTPLGQDRPPVLDSARRFFSSLPDKLWRASILKYRAERQI